MSLKNEHYIVAAAQTQALPIAPASLPAVVATLEMLEAMAQEVMAFPLDPHIEPAQVFIP